ncbi:hypothetical protein ACFOVU_15705 [Nocardiopsis sediminis]|uniref:Bacterial EndoU nuclease domain-containing protein n=1 Tax=Nocardiopsis sediminis TaxID=1778267 RepID=A0ABV8FR66_9ACTN
MLRRIHDPERGAGFIEHGAVILLVAAIAATVITSGVSGRVSALIASAIDSVEKSSAGDSEGDGPGAPQGSDQSNEPGDEGGDDGNGRDDSGGGGVRSSVGDGLSAVGDGLADLGTGAWNAVTDTWDGVVDAWDGLWDNVGQIIDDPGQWATDTWDSTLDGLTGTWDAITTDPVGWGLDLLFSEETQENWNNGNHLEAIGQGITENAVALIPYFGWGKKLDRLGDIADGGGNDRVNGSGGDSEGDGDQRADGDEERRDDTSRPSCIPQHRYVRAGAISTPVHNPGPRRCTITEQVNQHIDDRHTENGRLRTPDATVWGVGREERTRIINETLAQDPEGVLNTDNRSGTVHVGEFDEPVGRAGDSQGGYPIYEVEVVLRPDGSVRTAYPSGYIPQDN